MNIAKISNKSSILQKQNNMSNKGKDRKKNLPHGIHIMEPNNPSAQKLQRHWNHPVLSREKHAWELTAKKIRKKIPHPGAISSSSTWQPRIF